MGQLVRAKSASSQPSIKSSPHHGLRYASEISWAAATLDSGTSGGYSSLGNDAALLQPDLQRWCDDVRQILGTIQFALLKSPLIHSFRGMQFSGQSSHSMYSMWSTSFWGSTSRKWLLTQSTAESQGPSAQPEASIRYASPTMQRSSSPGGRWAQLETDLMVMPLLHQE